MGAAIDLTNYFCAATLQLPSKRSRAGGQRRRLFVLAEIFDGKRSSDAARFAGVGQQIVCD